MARAQNRRFVCRECGTPHMRWTGRCEGCGNWNTVEEEISENRVFSKKRSSSVRASSLAVVPLEGENAPRARRNSGIGEFDRVCGGGLSRSSAILIGGDPGIGKSTLLLQIAHGLAGVSGARILYVSGEESIEQIRQRAQRLDCGSPKGHIALASETRLETILEALENKQTGEKFDAVIVDSIQTIYLEALESAPGTMLQLRACTHELIRTAKKRDFILLLVGHVTKEGMIAGPRALEHMVDTVLYFEGERGHHFRILRAVKNRFGATNEIGVFEMHATGLYEVKNPSSLFLNARDAPLAGSMVFAGIEGNRPLLMEIQALVAPSNFGSPRRAVVGWDHNRLAMILAVLEARTGSRFGALDVYLSIAGGLRITEAAADLAVALALLSARFSAPLPHSLAAFGEIGLSGDIRYVPRAEERVREARKLGFETILCAPFQKSKSPKIRRHKIRIS